MTSEIYTALADLFSDTILVSGFVSSSETGDRTYSAGVTIDCMVFGKQQLVKNSQGQDQISTVQVITKGYYGINPLDLIQIPVRFDLREPAIISVEKYTDENGPHHETIYFE